MQNRKLAGAGTLRLLCALFAVGLLALAPVWLPAQTDTGRVQGTVSDQEGAVIPGATVTVTNQGTSAVYTAISDSAGNFTFPVVPRGNYKADVQVTGFQSQSVTFQLSVSQVQSLNFQLQVGAAATTIEVTSAAPLIDTSTSATGEVIQGRQVTELPLNGRNFTQLALLTPGVTRGAYGDIASGGGANNNVETFRNAETGGAALSANGLRPQSDNFILDGTDNNESLVNTIIFFPPAEAIEEFRVSTSVAPAEFGRAGGAIVETSIKSGTNSIHGSAFEFLRNSVFDANDAYFSPGTPKASFKRNQFGGTLGMPIFKDRLFIFGDYQGLRQSRPQNAEIITVPTERMKSGDFGELLGTGQTTSPDQFESVTGCTAENTPHVNGAIYDPTTCQPFDQNKIPAGRQNPAALAYLNAFPMQNIPNLVVNNYTEQRVQTLKYNDFDVRLDYTLSSRDILFGRYSYGQDNFDETSRLPNLPAGPGSGGNINHPRGVTAGYTHTFSATLVNDARFGYTRSYFAYIPPFFGTPISANLGIVNANRNALTGGGALIGGNGGTGEQIEYTGDGGPYTVPEHTYQGIDTLSWSHGKHSFRFGTSIIQREVQFFQGNDSKGYFILGGNTYPHTGRFTGYEVSELFSGFSDYELGASQSYFDTYNWETGYFAQDDWKVNQRLTLNLGFRYDLYTNPYEENDQQSNFDINTHRLLVAGQNGNSRSLVDTDFGNVAPRVGFAYSLNEKGSRVLRGGYGIFYFLDRGGIGNQLSNNPDFNGIGDYLGSTGYRITLTGQAPLGTNDNTVTFPNGPNYNNLPPPQVQVDRENPLNATVHATLPHNKTSRIQQWNLQFQQQVDSNTALNLAYVGTKSDHLLNYYNLNAQQLVTGAYRFDPSLTVDVAEAEGSSRYDGLQASLNRRLNSGFQYTVSYTWSHTRDDASGAFAGDTSRFFIVNNEPDYALYRGDADQDIRNFFTASTLYELPYGKGKMFGANANPILQQVLGGWQWNNIVTLGGGTPFDVTVNGTPNNRADLLSGIGVENGKKKPLGGGPGIYWFNPAAFTHPPAVDNVYTRAGNVGRNRFHGPGVKTWDTSIFKDFGLTERVKMQFRTEAYNLTNTAQLTNPDSNVDDGVGNFGVIRGTRESSERQIQFALRFTF